MESCGVGGGAKEKAKTSKAPGVAQLLSTLHSVPRRRRRYHHHPRSFAFYPIFSHKERALTTRKAK